MENKNNILLFSVVFFVAGIFIGWAIWGGSSDKLATLSGVHLMPDGQVMSNEGTGGMSGMMDDMMKGLSGKTGDAFDRAFLEEMIVHHQGAVLMAQSALKSAKHQEIKDLSINIISAQNNEIAQMRGWLKSWYNIDY